jgi:hypothetical protein
MELSNNPAKAILRMPWRTITPNLRLISAFNRVFMPVL